GLPLASRRRADRHVRDRRGWRVALALTARSKRAGPGRVAGAKGRVAIDASRAGSAVQSDPGRPGTGPINTGQPPPGNPERVERSTRHAAKMTSEIVAGDAPTESTFELGGASQPCEEAPHRVVR